MPAANKSYYHSEHHHRKILIQIVRDICCVIKVHILVQRTDVLHYICRIQTPPYADIRTRKIFQYAGKAFALHNNRAHFASLSILFENEDTNIPNIHTWYFPHHPYSICVYISPVVLFKIVYDNLGTNVFFVDCNL